MVAQVLGMGCEEMGFFQRRIFSCASSIAVALSVAATPASAQDLLKITQDAIVSDPAYRAIVFQTDADREIVPQARSALLPHVAATAGYAYTYQDIIASDVQVFDTGSNDYPVIDAGVGMDLSLFSYSQYMNLGRARQERARAEAALEAATQDLYLRVADRYFTALVAVEILTHVRADKKALKAHLRQAEARASRGLTRKADALDAKARFFEAEAWEMEVEGTLLDAIQALQEVTGYTPGELSKLAAAFELTPHENMDRGYWIDEALERNPRMAVATHAAAAADIEVKRQRGARAPEMSFRVAYDYSDVEGTLFGGGSETTTATATVNLRVPIFSGLRTGSKVREARHLSSVREQEGVQVRREIERNTVATLRDVLSGTAKINALSASVAAQESATATLRRAYRGGSASSLDLIDAERDLLFARTDLAQARYNALLGDLRLRHAVGTLTIEDIRRVNDVLSGGSADLSAILDGDG